MRNSCTLYSHSIVWIGRLGKALLLASGSIIVFDIIGRRRLRQCGDLFHDAMRLSLTFVQPSRELNSYSRNVLERFLRLEGGVKEIIKEPKYLYNEPVDAVMSDEALEKTHSLLVITMIVSWIALFFIVAFVWAVSLIVLHIVSALAWMLRHKRLMLMIRMFAFVALVSGFLMDMLAS